METEKIGMVREIYRAVKNWAISRVKSDISRH